MRNVSLQGLQSMIAQQTQSIWIFGLVFSPTGDDTWPVFRLCNNTENIIHPWPSGDEYFALPFEVTLASDNEESPPQARIKVDNVTLAFSDVVRRTNNPPDVDLYVFRLEEEVDPDGEGMIFRPYIELGPSRFRFLSASANSLTVEGVIGYEHDILNEPATQHRFTPFQAPALFS